MWRFAVFAFAYDSKLNIVWFCTVSQTDYYFFYHFIDNIKKSKKQVDYLIMKITFNCSPEHECMYVCSKWMHTSLYDSETLHMWKTYIFRCSFLQVNNISVIITMKHWNSDKQVCESEIPRGNLPTDHRACESSSKGVEKITF